MLRKLLPALLIASLSLPIVTAEAKKGPRCQGQKATKVAKPGGSRLIGTKGRDVLVGRGGDDTILGGGGNDIICGGGGDDAVDGEGGNDRIDGGTGDDSLFGSGGRDVLRGGTGFDFLEGNAGNDTLNGGDKRQPPFDAASYVDAKGPVTIDVKRGRASGRGVGKDKLIGVEDFDGSEFDDTMIGGDAGYGDGFFGLGGNDTMTGNGGDDVLRGGPGDDVISGGLGYDSSQYFQPPEETPQPVTVDLVQNVSTGQGSDTLEGIELVQGSHGDDTLIGSAGDDELHGLNGDDTITGAAGNDFIAGGGGDDTIDGGDGNDIADHLTWEGWIDFLDIPAAAVTVNLSTNSSSGQGTDSLVGIEEVGGTSLDDSLTGSSGPDTLIGFQGDDQLFGGDGNDRLEADCDYATGSDCPDGNGTADAIDGGAGTDECANGETTTSCEGPIAAPSGSRRAARGAVSSAYASQLPRRGPW